MHAHARTVKRDHTLLKEIESLAQLIEKRRKWLNDPANKNRGTYNAVLKDTQEMEEKLNEMEERYEG